MKDFTLDEKILATAFKDKKSALELSTSIKSDYFVPTHRWLFDSIEHFFNDPSIKSIPSRNMVAEFVKDDNAKLAQYDRIMLYGPNPNELKWLIKKIQVRYNNKVQKDVFKKVSRVLESAAPGSKRVDHINKVMKQSVIEIDSIGQRKAYKEGELKESAAGRSDRYTKIKDNPDIARGIMTGLSTFDRITNGLHPGEFMIIAGSTGTGKSILMHNIAVNAYLGKNSIYGPPEECDGGRNVLFFSLEMPKDAIERRIDACMAGVYSNHIRDGLLPEEDEQKYFQCLRFQETYDKHFHIVDVPKGASPREIELKYIEISENFFKPDLVVIDYLGIMSSNNSTGSDWMDLGVISEQLHEIGRIYEVPIITASQVNRTKDGAEVYNTRRIARSDMVPNNANIIIQIGCREDEDLRTDMPIYITKMRDGEKGMFTLSKDFGRMKVIDIVEDTFVDEDEVI